MKSGFKNIDANLQGLQTKRMYALAASEAMGRETFVRQLALNASLHYGVLYIQFNCAKDDFIESLLGVKGSIPYHKLAQKPWDEQIRNQVEETRASLKDHELFIEQLDQYDESGFYTLIKTYVNDKGVKLIIIDDEEKLLRASVDELDQTDQFINLLFLKAMLFYLDCCGIVLKEIPDPPSEQINECYIPQFDDFRGDTNLIKAADEVWMFLRLEYYGVQKDDVDTVTKRRIDLVKFTNDGELIDILYFKFNRNYTSIRAIKDVYHWDGGG